MQGVGAKHVSQQEYEFGLQKGCQAFVRDHADMRPGWVVAHLPYQVFDMKDVCQGPEKFTKRTRRARKVPSKFGMREI